MNFSVNKKAGEKKVIIAVIVSWLLASLLNLFPFEETFVFFLYIVGLFFSIFLESRGLILGVVGLILYSLSSLLGAKFTTSFPHIILFMVGILGMWHLSKYLKRKREALEELNLKYNDAKEELESSRKLLGEYIMKELSYSDILAQNLQEVYYYTLRGLIGVFENRDPYTRGHSERVAEYAVKIAYALKLPPRQIRLIRYAAQLHDVGRISIPLAILNKVEALNDEEFELIKSHVIRGELISSPLEFLHEATFFIRHHHERVNGAGYPDRLRQEEIPLGARVIAVVDAFDAMTSSRAYRRSLSIEEALAELKNNAGKQHDPFIVEVFIRVIEEMRKTSELSKPIFQPSVVV